MSDDLDAKFGRCEAPVRFNNDEATLAPRSLFTLDHYSARHIVDLVRVSQRQIHNFSCFPFNDFTMLWLVSGGGEILIAIEEGVYRGGNLVEAVGPTLFPLPNAIKSEYVKLGHPALVGCQPARIGGEIICDLEEDPPQWYITNRSGRYGLNLGRTPQQLANVAGEFLIHGIQLKVDFI